jgi:hypothetical protein
MKGREILRGAGAIAIVMDRENEAARNGAEKLREMGGGWRTGYDIWAPSGFRFLLLLAPTRKRIKARAPLAFCAFDLEALRQATVAACLELNAVKCAWIMSLNDDAMATVQAETLRDAVVEGVA